MQEIFITDLDGTLLRTDQTISSYTAKVLTEALERGSLITYATARGLRSSKRVTEPLKWKHPVILYNGALIYDIVNDQVIDGSWLDNQISNEIIALAKL